MTSTPENWWMLLVLQPAFLVALLQASLQLWLLYGVACLLTKRLSTRPILANRAWFTLVILGLVSLPAQWLGWGWPYVLHQQEIVVVGAAAPAVSSEQSHLPIMQPVVVIGDGLLSDNLADRPLPGRQSETQAVNVNHPSLPAPLEQTDTSSVSAAGSQMVQSLVKALTVAYLGSVLFMLIKLVIRLLSLRRVYARSVALPAGLADEVERCLSHWPQSPAVEIRQSVEVHMPMTFGAYRACVLVPADFDRWSSAQRELVIHHELAHIQRRDWLAELAGSLLLAVYWFHPAAWWTVKQLRLTRETATDALVIQRGMSPVEYARELLAILERITATTSQHQLWPGGVSMSLYDDIEGRVRSIMTFRVTPPRRSINFALDGCLVLTLALTSVRVIAQNPPPIGQPSPTSTTSTDTEGTATENPATVTVQPASESMASGDSRAAAENNDLLHRLIYSPVTSTRGADFACLFNVQGRVLSPSGQPVQGAVVCLCESSLWRIRSITGQTVYMPAQLPEPVQDVIARTTTDSEGRYQFANIKSPPLHAGQTMNACGQVVAAHPGVGLGFAGIKPSASSIANESHLDVRLSPMIEIGGVYKTPDGQPIAGATLCISTIDELIPSEGLLDLRLAQRFELFGSQLMPICKSDAKGEFRFKNIPTGFAAIALAEADSRYASSLAALSTDPRQPEGSRGKNVRFSYEPKQLIGTQGNWIADPGVRIRGVVLDDKGQPVSQVQVGLEYFGSVMSAADGRFEIRIPTPLMQTTVEGVYRLCALDFSPPESTLLLPRQISFAVSRDSQLIFEAQKAIANDQVRLSRGVLLRGSVVDNLGQPVSQVMIEELSGEKTRGRPNPKALSGPDGSFQLVLSPDVHTLHYSSRVPGLDLPEHPYRSINRVEAQAKLPHIDVDLTDGLSKTLQPIQVNRIQPVDVVVQMPDGSPAKNADVSVWFRRTESSVPGLPHVFPMEEPDEQKISNNVLTDAQGKARLVLRGRPGRATVDASLVVDGLAHTGRIWLNDQAKPQVIRLRRPPKVEGLVLKDGQPFPEVLVQVHWTQPIAESSFTMGSDLIMTDAQGRYQLQGQVGRTYYSSIAQAPGLSGSTNATSVTWPGEYIDAARLRIPNIECHTYQASLAGVVVDQQGQPIAGATVAIANEHECKSSWWIGHKANSQFVTDAEGRFVLRNIKPGVLDLEVVPGRAVPLNTRAKPHRVNTDQGDVRLVVDAASASESNPSPER